MRIVAIVALDQSLIHLVMERPVKLLLHFLMAAVAQLRQLFLHQVLAFLSVVGRVAVNAANVVLQVG